MFSDPIFSLIINIVTLILGITFVIQGLKLRNTPVSIPEGTKKPRVSKSTTLLICGNLVFLAGLYKLTGPLL